MSEPFSLTAFALASIVGGILGNRSDAAVQSAVRAVVDRLRLGGPAVNHDVQRAIRKSQLQATLLLCEVLLKKLVAGESFWGRAARQFGGGNDDARWVIAVRSYLYDGLKEASSAAYVPPSSEAEREVELLLTGSEAGAQQRVSELRERLIDTLLLELELLHGKAPAAFIEMIREGWVETLPGSIDERLDWFAAMCAFFAHELKHNQPLANIFQSQLLVGLKVDGEPLTLELVRSGLRELGCDLVSRLDRVDEQLAGLGAGQVEGFTSLKGRADEMLALLAAVPDADAQRRMLEEAIRLGTGHVLARLDEGFREAEKKRKGEYVRSIPVSRPLLVRLEASRKTCEEADIPYRTPNLLLALLQPDRHLTRKIFNRIENGLGDLLYKSFLSYISEEQPSLEAGRGYTSFDWYEREDVMIGQREANADGHPVVAEKHLLLGILQTNSKTVEDLRAMLGEKFQILLEMLRNEAAPNSNERLRTPGLPIRRKG